MFEAISNFLTSLNSVTPLGIITLLALVLFYQTKNMKATEKQHDTLVTMRGNDLHELPEMADDLRTLVETLQRMEVKMSEEFSYIRARLNGGNK